MKLFLDTANIEEIKEINELGLLDGVTTNPSLISKTRGDFKETVLKISEMVDGPISAEVLSRDYKGMIHEARELIKVHKNVVIKIPVTEEGLKATSKMPSYIPVNMTLIFSTNQALLAAKAGASFISPFLGRIDDAGGDGIEVLKEILQVVKDYNTEVIAASIRSSEHIRKAALLGCDIATVPYKIFKQLIKHPLTDIGIQRFENDWKHFKEEN